MAIEAKTVEQLADLVKIRLSADEVEVIRRDLSAVLAYVGQLDQVDAQGIEPMTSAAEGWLPLVADEPGESLAPADVARAAGGAFDPARALFAVPAVFAGERE